MRWKYKFWNYQPVDGAKMFKVCAWRGSIVRGSGGRGGLNLYSQPKLQLPWDPAIGVPVGPQILYV